MNKEDLAEYKKKLAELSEEDKKERNLYLKGLADGTLQGPPTGYSSIDKPWLKYYADESIKVDIPKQKFIDYVVDCNKNNMNKKALSYFNNKITFEEMFRKKDEAVKALLAAGVREGDYVSICLPTLPETFYLVDACNEIGAVANLIDPRINEERIEECLKGKSKIIFTIDAYADKMANIRKKDEFKNMVQVKASNSLDFVKKFAYKIKTNFSSKGFINWNDFLKKGKDQKIIKSDFKENQVAAIIYSSGTTGVPKAVELTNEDIVGVSVQQKHVLRDMVAGDTFLDIMPPFIAYGFVCGMVASISTGMELILIPKFDPEKFDELVMKNKPNHILGVPSFFETLAKSKLVKENTDLSFIKYCIAGGDKLHVESEKEINEFFKKHNVQSPMIKGYGMSELSSGVMITPQSEYHTLGTVGAPLVKNNVMIKSTDGETELGYNQEGELYISGPTIMGGYGNNKEEEEKVLYQDEAGTTWVRTGDLAEIRPDGNVEIKGRLKRMIVRPDGHNVFPSVIEDLLMQNPAVENCAVVGIKAEGQLNGEYPTAFVVLKEEYKGDEEEIMQQLIDLSNIKLPPRDVALDYKFIDKMPMTSNGKVDYNSLIENDFSVGKRI